MKEQELVVPRERLAKITAALACASEAAFEDAERIAQDDAGDDLSHVIQAVGLFIGELRRNIESKERLLADLQLSQAELQETLEQVRKQRLAIQDLGTPIIDIWEHILTLPLIGFIDSQRASTMTDKLLQRIVTAEARCVIVDMTGIELVDTMTANHLIRMLRAAELLGSFCVVTGIGPEIALTLTELGVDLPRMRTKRTLRDGLKACFAHLQAEKDASGPPGIPNNSS